MFAILRSVVYIIIREMIQAMNMVFISIKFGQI